MTLASQALAHDVVFDDFETALAWDVEAGWAALGEPAEPWMGGAFALAPADGPSGHRARAVRGSALVQTHRLVGMSVYTTDPGGSLVEMDVVDVGGAAGLIAEIVPEIGVWTRWTIDLPDGCGTEVAFALDIVSKDPTPELHPTWFDDLAMTGDICPEFMDLDGDQLCPRGFDRDGDGSCVGAGEPAETAVDCDDDEMGAQCLALEVSLSGTIATVTATGARPGDRVRLLVGRSDAGQCAPAIGLCVDVVTRRSAAMAVADANGTAVIESGFGGSPGGTYYVQAVVLRRQNSDVSNVVTLDIP